MALKNCKECGQPRSTKAAVCPHCGHGSVAMTSAGSGGNMLAGIISFFIPGLGQLLQGRIIMALVFFLLASAFWFILLGWVFHLLTAFDAARYKGR